MTRSATGILIRLVVLLCLSSLSAKLCCLEPAWTRSLSAELVAGPVPFDNRVYAVGSDRSVTCLSADGHFLWSRLLSGKPTGFLTLTGMGSVYAVTEPGTIAAFNADGSPLWQLKGSQLPLFAPYDGRDGRFFLVYRNSLRCVSSAGSLMWTLPLDVLPVLPPSETGDGDVLLACEGGLLLRVSPFGAILEKTALAEPVTVLGPVPGGFFAGYASGTVQVFDVRNARIGPARSGTEPLWRYSGRNGCKALCFGDSTLLALQGDGSIIALNATDGSVLWTNTVGRTVNGPVFIRYEYGQFNIALQGVAGAWTPSGRKVWQSDIPLGVSAPVVSEQGRVFASDSNWVLYGYQAETRINAEKKTHKTVTYGILHGVSEEYGMPFESDSYQLNAFFGAVSDAIRSGTVGTLEPEYARRLSEIVSNSTGDHYGGRAFDEWERGRAASLLGQLGSFEYRKVLIDQAYGDYDSSLAIGIMYGLASIGYDWDGASLSAIEYLIKAAGSTDDAVLCSAGDALYAIIRYSAGKTAYDGTKLLSGFLESPYSKQVQIYARQVMGNILQ